jgi:hypothetical protein
MARRPSYDDKFRASAVVMLEGAGYPDRKGALHKVAVHLGVPDRTISRWFRKENNVAPDDLVTEKRGELLDGLRDLAYELLTAINTDIRDNGVDAVRAATALGIVIDKIQLLTGGPTENSNQTIRIQRDADDIDTFAHIAQRAGSGSIRSGTIQRPGYGTADRQDDARREAGH